MTSRGFDPFFVNHPVLNHRRVKVIAYLMDESYDAREERYVNWARLTWEERLELERLLAKAASRT